MRDRPEEQEALQATAALQQSLGYAFHDLALLRLALIHRSFIYEAISPPANPAPQTAYGRAREGRNAPGTDNEQLEFLGDAVLGLAVTELLYREFPDRSEGELTRIRASLVSRDRLAGLGTFFGLGDYLLLGQSAEEVGARTKPAVLADAAEAVLAAIYLDAANAGADGLATVRGLVKERLLAPALPDIRHALDAENGRGALRDFKTLLQERVQAGKAGRLLYVDVAEEGPPHQRRFTVQARLEADERSAVLATAEGGSKKEAQQRAAESALAAWPLTALQTAPAACGEQRA